MDFNDTPEEAEYREKTRAWLEANVPKGVKLGSTDGDDVPTSKAWQAKKAAAGYACITWPVEWGGQSGTPIQAVIFAEEESRHVVPGNPFAIGLGMCVPTVCAHSDDETRRRVAPPAIRGEKIWCQLFSEPSGGSDVAAVRTRAARAADETGDWVLNGQKVWTTGAQFADFAIIICRTDPNVPKHKGLTMFWIDMSDPGVEVRPIHTIAGVSRFNEVFITDVRIPDSQRLGAVNGGWSVALFTLMNERNTVSASSGLGWEKFMDLARDLPGYDGATALKDATIRAKIADMYVKTEGLNHVRNRTITALSKGQTPGPESSIVKVVLASQMQETSNAALEMLDRYGVIDDPALSPMDALFQTKLFYSAGFRIAGGTDEILRNILAERVLGLPGDVRLDKDVAFKDIPTGR